MFSTESSYPISLEGEARRLIKTNIPELSPYQLYSFRTIGDGSCFFHALANAFYTGYRREVVGGQHVSRRDIVRSMRREMASQLTEINPRTGLTYYQSIANGNLNSLGRELPEYSLDGFARHLDSDQPVSYEVISYISELLGKSIYILDRASGDLYLLPDIPSDHQPAIILYYLGCHYEMIGVKEEGDYCTHFSPRHPVIAILRSRYLAKKGSGTNIKI